MKPTTLFTIGLSFGLIANIAIADSTVNQAAVAASDKKSQKIEIVKKMYQQDIDNQGQDYPVVLQQYASKDLQAAMKLEQDYFDKEQMSCHIGYDVLWDSQDPDYTQDKQFSVTKQGMVQVDLAQGSTINYELECNDRKCFVHDVIMNQEGESLKSYLHKECQ